MAARPPRLDSLITFRCAEMFGGYSSAEESVRNYLGTSASIPSKVSDLVSSGHWLAKRAGEGILFAVDGDTFYDAIKSVDGPPPELPPLPFDRIVVESDDDTTWPTHALLDDGSIIEDKAVVEVIGIEEEVRGEKWSVWFWGHQRGAEIDMRDIVERRPMIMLAEIHPDRITFFDGKSDATHPSDDLFWRMCVEAVHLLTARGVSLATVPYDRAMRRRAERKSVTLPQSVYWVRIEERQINAQPGRCEREYHCRWLVRGHWRRYADGRKTWVKAYIKGPAGAPWRGRPVYHVPAAA